MDQPYPKTRWHQLLARMLELLLTPVGIDVESEVPVMAEPPRADILLLRRRGKDWSSEQRARLADGLRDTDADHLLIEFKRTEGVSERAIRQLLVYDFLYAAHRRLGRNRLASFLVSGPSPQDRSLLAALGYEPGTRAGVYRSEQRLASPATLILLNELDDAPHNAPWKCFATRRPARSRALSVFQTSGWARESLDLERFLFGLWRLLMKTDFPDIDELTPEFVMAEGKEWVDVVLAATPPEYVLSRFTPQQRLEGLDPAQRLEGLDPAQRLEGLDPEEIRQYLEQLEKGGKGH